MQHIHARDLEDFLSSFRVNQIIVILYIIYLYSYILGETHRPETCIPAMSGLGETRRIRRPGVQRRDNVR
jgi:hypothetical protein